MYLSRMFSYIFCVFVMKFVMNFVVPFPPWVTSILTNTTNHNQVGVINTNK